MAQLEQSLKALDILPKLTPEVEAKINKIVNTNPDAPLNFLKWKQHDPIRPV